jgi:hypothetical protein
MGPALPPCPPCPKCWSSSAVSFTEVTASGAYCRCERCGTVWFHDNERLAATLREGGLSSEKETNARPKNPG